MKTNSVYFVSVFFFLCSILLVISCSPKADSSADTNSIKFQQYYIQGEQLYIKNCSNCHQRNGKGLGLLYPPVATSDFIDNNKNMVVCIIRNGISGPLIVNGSSYNKEMPAIPSLTDLEIAEIATYLYNSWGREIGIIEVKEVSKIINSCQE